MASPDGRTLRGDRTRRRVSVRAAELASVHGLAGLTLGQIADDLGVAKSSVAAVFRGKEQLQLAAVAAAREIFLAEVVEPTAGLPAGPRRLAGLIEAYLRYVERPVFPGGCFMVATAAEYDSRPGPVRDALAELRRSWLGLLAAHAPAGDLPPELVAFEIDAVLAAAGTARNLLDDPGALEAARTILRARLAGASSGTGSTPAPGGRSRR